jgi:hypothetical protein
MAKHREYCKWLGESGLVYTYRVVKLPCKLQTGQEGNYVFAKKNPEGKWVPVYVDHGDLSIACTHYNPQWECILNRGATHFHCHLTTEKQARQDEQDDLLARYKNAYFPYGCNKLTASKPAAQDSSLTGLTELEIELAPLDDEAHPLPDLSALNPQGDEASDNPGAQPRA